MKEITFQVVDLVKKVGVFILENQKKINSEVIENKGLHDFVTYVDKTAEKQLVEELKLILPEAGFIAEEGTETYKGEKYNWIIDPLDGTTNYIHGISPFAISIALMRDNKLVMGVIYEISLKECFYAWEGSDAFLNGSKIQVSEAKTINESLISTGFPYYDYHRMDNFMNSLSYFIENSHGVRRLGSAATDLAYVACGRFESFYEYSLSPWDVAAGALIVERAGGKVCDFSGGDNYVFGKEIIAANSNTFDEFLNIVKGYYSN